VEDVLERDSVIPVLKRNFVSSCMGPGADGLAERQTESKKQAEGRLHLGGSRGRCSESGMRGQEGSSAQPFQLE